MGNVKTPGAPLVPPGGMNGRPKDLHLYIDNLPDDDPEYECGTCRDTGVIHVESFYKGASDGHHETPCPACQARIWKDPTL